METPIGTIIAWPGPLSTLPNDWKLCNGEYLTTSQYPDLRNVLQNYWGEYSGSPGIESFRLPDLRAVFLRGVNDDRVGKYSDPDNLNREPSRKGGVSNEVGSYQEDRAAEFNLRIQKCTIYAKPCGDFEENILRANNIRQGHQDYKLNSNSKETRPVNAYINYIIRAK